LRRASSRKIADAVRAADEMPIATDVTPAFIVNLVFFPARQAVVDTCHRAL
jgi:hypothetical protein